MPQGDPRLQKFHVALARISSQPAGKRIQKVSRMDTCDLDVHVERPSPTPRGSEVEPVVALDDALLLLDDLWRAEDDWRDFQPRKRAVSILQSFARRSRSTSAVATSLRDAKDLDAELNGGDKVSELSAPTPVPPIKLADTKMNSWRWSSYRQKYVPSDASPGPTGAPPRRFQTI